MARPTRTVEHERVEVRSRADLRAWLTRHHTQNNSIWLVTWKAATPEKSRTMLRLSPRNPKSKWSAVNKARVARLEAAGEMHPAGAAVIAAAKLSGTWTALDAVETLAIPPDLETALARTPRAATHFAAFPKSTRRGILEWITSAKTAETRARRITDTAEKAGANIRANTPRQPKR